MIYQELNKFNKIVFFEDTHEYIYHDKKCTSVTSVLSKFKKPFDKDKIAFFVAKKRGISKQEVLAEWDYENLISRDKGSEFHLYAENRLASKNYKFDSFKVPIELIQMFDKFYNISKDRLIPVKSEIVVGDYDLGICGMIDQLYFNVKSEMYEIWDWKTNKNVRDKSEYGNKLINGLEHLEECEMVTYSLQLLIYKYIIEKNTNIKIGDCYINWFHEKNPSYEIKKVLNLQDEAKFILNNYEKLVA